MKTAKVKLTLSKLHANGSKYDNVCQKPIRRGEVLLKNEDTIKSLHRIATGATESGDGLVQQCLSHGEIGMVNYHEKHHRFTPYKTFLN